MPSTRARARNQVALTKTQVLTVERGSEHRSHAGLLCSEIVAKEKVAGSNSPLQAMTSVIVSKSTQEGCHSQMVDSP